MAYDQSQQIYRDDEYNDITKDPVYADLYNESDYVLTQEDPTIDDHNVGIYKLSKKPDDEVLEQVTNPWDFLDKLESKGNNYRVMIIHVDRTFSIYHLNVSDCYNK